MDFIEFLIHDIIYKLTWCLRYNFCSAWFLEIVSVRTSVCVCVCLCVCPPPRLLITSGVMWRDMDLIRLVKQVL